MKFYAVAFGKKKGIFTSWEMCQPHVKNVRGAIYKSHTTLQDAIKYMIQNNAGTYASLVDDEKQMAITDFFNPSPDVQKTSKKTHKQTKISSFLTNSLDDSEGKTSQNKSDKHMETNSVQYVYTDGSCKHNGTAHARAGVGVFFGHNDPRNISTQFDGKQSNNTAELMGILLACERILVEPTDSMKPHKWILFTDSKYAIGMCTTTGLKHAKKDWVEMFPNKDLVRKLYNTIQKMSNLTLQYIRAHTGLSDVHSMGNEQADLLASQAIGSSTRSSTQLSRIYLNVKYVDKDEAKQKGCQWDIQRKKWYCYSNNLYRDILVKRFGNITQ